MQQYLEALSTVADHPLALVGYLAVVIAWLIVALHYRKASKLFATLKELPEEQRLEAIKLEYRTSPKKGLTAEQWLQSRRITYAFAAFAITCFALITMIGLALWFSKASNSTTWISFFVVCFGFVGLVIGFVFWYSKSSGVDPQKASKATQTNWNVEAKQSPVIGNVGENVYILYVTAREEKDEITRSEEKLTFVTEDAHLDRKGLVVRFSIYNVSNKKVKIYNFHTVEYAKQQTIYYCGGPRCFLEITPDRPFIERDQTFEIEPGDNVSFRLRYRFNIGGGAIQVIFGIVAYYHTITGELGKLVSDHLYLVNPSKGRSWEFDEETAESILNIQDRHSFSFGWTESSAQGQLRKLREALDRHRDL